MTLFLIQFKLLLNEKHLLQVLHVEIRRIPISINVIQCHYRHWTRFVIEWDEFQHIHRPEARITKHILKIRTLRVPLHHNVTRLLELLHWLYLNNLLTSFALVRILIKLPTHWIKWNSFLQLWIDTKHKFPLNQLINGLQFNRTLLEWIFIQYLIGLFL